MSEPSSDLISDPLRPLPLTELRLLADGRRWRVAQRIAGLESLTTVQGSIQALHHGTALEVTAEAETIVTLCCDRCLQHFNHPLRAEVHELVELRGQGEAGTPTDAELGEISLELARAGMPEGADLDDRLDPAGSFDPERWLFEQLSLRLPLVNRCGDDCPGPARWSSEATGLDPRWAALQKLGLGGNVGSGAEDEASARSTSEPAGSTAAGRSDAEAAMRSESSAAAPSGPSREG